MLDEVYNEYIYSKKKHLIITGSLNSGKSTLFNAITNELDITTIKSKYFNENNERVLKLAFNDNWSKSYTIKDINNKYFEIFSTKVVDVLNKLSTNYLGIDEVGFLESNEENYTDKIIELVSKVSVIAILRKDKDSRLLNYLRNLDDAYYYDLDERQSEISCIVMASGYSKRFKSNKLLAKIDEVSLIEITMKQIPYEMFKEVIVVTRYQEVLDIVSKYPIKCIIHDLKYQSDTIKVGLRSISNVKGAMFLTCDQPLRTKESLKKTVLTFKEDINKIVRLSYQGKVNNPIIFPSIYFDELMKLEKENGGNTILKKHQNDIVYCEAKNKFELLDVDYQGDLNSIKEVMNKVGKER